MEKIKVDFSGVEESSSYDIAPGKYKARVEDVELKTGDKAPYLQWNLKIMSGTASGLHINHITSLSPNALFGLRDTLIAMGVNVPKAAVSIDPSKFIGKTFGIETFMNKKDGKEYANVKKVFALDATAPIETPTSSAPSAGDELPFDRAPSKPNALDEISIDLG